MRGNITTAKNSNPVRKTDCCMSGYLTSTRKLHHRTKKQLQYANSTATQTVDFCEKTQPLCSRYEDLTAPGIAECRVKTRLSVKIVLDNIAEKEEGKKCC